MINKVDMVLKIDPPSPPMYTLHTWFSMTRLINNFLECVCVYFDALCNRKHLSQLSDELDLQYLGRKRETPKLLVSSQGRQASTLGLPPYFHWKAPWHPNSINFIRYYDVLAKQKISWPKDFSVFMLSNNVSNHTRNFVYLNFW